MREESTKNRRELRKGFIMPGWYFRVLRWGALIIIALTIIAGLMWFDLITKPDIAKMEKDWKALPPEEVFTEEEKQQMQKRIEYIRECEEVLIKMDETIMVYSNLAADQKEFIEEYGE